MIDFEMSSSLQLCYNHCYVENPLRFNQLSDCTRADSMARQDIAYLEGVIKQLKDYRVQVAKRAALLETVPYNLQLSIIRRKPWRTDPVTYSITISRIYLDESIRPLEILRETYPGKERHKALARFKELQKQYAGIETVVDIEKGKWE